MKIIHIVENLDKGAVENWLVNIFIESRKIKPSWDWTFYCILGRRGKLDEKVISAGGKIIYSPVTVSNKIQFLKHLRSTLIKEKYDIIHSHHDYLSGFYLLATTGISFKKRILHIHNTDRALPIGNRLLHKVLLKPFKRLGLYFSDIVLGISENTIDEFVGEGWRNNSKFQLLYYGVDFSKFDAPIDQEEYRRQFNIPNAGKIILFVGRMNDLKNPVYVVDVLHGVLKKRSDVYAVFVGKGDQEEAIKQKADQYGINNHVRIIGWREDIAGIMKSSDIFIFPRKEYPKEGLGLVVVEAQGAGLPLFITRGIVNDAIIIKELAFYNELANLEAWEEQVNKVLNKGALISKKDSLAIMKASRFELNIATSNLIGIYE